MFFRDVGDMVGGVDEHPRQFLTLHVFVLKPLLLALTLLLLLTAVSTIGV